MIRHKLLLDFSYLKSFYISYQYALFTKPDLIVIVSSPTIYFVENQLQINTMANGIVKNKRKYSLPAKMGAKHAPMTTKKSDITMYLF